MRRNPIKANEEELQLIEQAIAEGRVKVVQEGVSGGPQSLSWRDLQHFTKLRNDEDDK